MFKFEDDHYWPAEKTRFWAYILIGIASMAILAFAIYGWILYQAKVTDSEMSSHRRTSPAAVPLSTAVASTNVAQPSLSPETNPN